MCYYLDMRKEKLHEYVIFIIDNIVRHDKDGNYDIADVDPIGLSVMLDPTWSPDEIIAAVKQADEDSPDNDGMGPLIDKRRFPKTTARKYKHGFLIYDAKSGLPMISLRKAIARPKPKTEAGMSAFEKAIREAMKSTKR